MPKGSLKLGDNKYHITQKSKLKFYDFCAFVVVKKSLRTPLFTLIL